MTMVAFTCPLCGVASVGDYTKDELITCPGCKSLMRSFPKDEIPWGVYRAKLHVMEER